MTRAAKFAWTAIAILSAVARAEKIYVFCPSLSRPNAVQAALQAKLSGEVTVFGRLADFTAMVAQVPPDVILAPRSLAEQFSAYHTFLRGTRKGAASEEAFLISTKPIETSQLASINLGVVGILERGQLSNFVQSTLGASPKLKVVTKLEDLLPLLTFGSADAVLVGEGDVEDIKGRSQAALKTTAVPGRISLVVAAAKGDPGKADALLRSLGATEKKMLGVDGWSK
jgi:hypothetical protein